MTTDLDLSPGAGMGPDNATEYRRADLCASGQQVRVKPLEWEPSKTSYTQANCVLGQYQITFLGEFECWQLSAPHKPGSDWKDGFTRHASKSAAKAAARADYERRILATLTPAPQPEGQGHRSFPDARSDIGILLAQIDWLQECLGETLEADDAAIVAQIRADWAPAPSAATPTAQDAGPTDDELDEAWKDGFNAGFGEAKLTDRAALEAYGREKVRKGMRMAADIAKGFGGEPAPMGDGCGTIILRNLNGHDVAQAKRRCAALCARSRSGNWKNCVTNSPASAPRWRG